MTTENRLNALAALLAAGQTWENGRLVSEQRYSAYEIRDVLGWPEPTAPPAPTVTAPERPEDVAFRDAILAEGADLIGGEALRRLEAIDEDERRPSDEARYQEWVAAGDVLLAARTCQKTGRGCTSPAAGR
ncbi:hypothetical protein [Streptomyces sp. NRRL S-350]|uniref:hypothetical protein n=1 Tax=Streptomyces sp. NRRL S-350 TaxID=1463902 RepID=UPI0004BE5C12|nr:hypothetical protein [Streptomyces sp. NRRL S-350]